jgi:glucose-1-phosphate adenylyltransferase
VVSADAVYAQDYGRLVDEHMESGCALTMVTTEVDPGDAGRYGVVQARDGMVRDYAYKPDEPQGNVVANEVFAFRAPPLLDALEELAGDAGEDGLDDLGDDLLPGLVRDGQVREHRFEGFWRDVGTVDAYWSCHMDLLGDPPPIDVDDPDWPILTHAATPRGPARTAPDAEVDRTLLAAGARVAGTVERSVIGRGAVVEAGAVVRESVLLPGTVVRAGASVERAVLDDGVEVAADAWVGRAKGDVALVGLGATVRPDDDVPAGARFPETDQDD